MCTDGAANAVETLVNGADLVAIKASVASFAFKDIELARVGVEGEAIEM